MPIDGIEELKAQQLGSVGNMSECFQENITKQKRGFLFAEFERVSS
jgi:hypothetical protein